MWIIVFFKFTKFSESKTLYKTGYGMTAKVSNSIYKTCYQCISSISIFFCI